MLLLISSGVHSHRPVRGNNYCPAVCSSTPGVPQVSLDSPDVPLGQEGVPQHHASCADDAPSSLLSAGLLRRVLLGRWLHQRWRLQVGFGYDLRQKAESFMDLKGLRVVFLSLV